MDSVLENTHPQMARIHADEYGEDNEIFVRVTAPDAIRNLNSIIHLRGSASSADGSACIRITTLQPSWPAREGSGRGRGILVPVYRERAGEGFEGLGIRTLTRPSATLSRGEGGLE